MNVGCSNCPAKYAIGDDKVKGRKVRITCKRCGSPIIVDGTGVGEPVVRAPSLPPAAPPPSAPSPAAMKAAAAMRNREPELTRPIQKTMMGIQASPNLAGPASPSRTPALAPTAPASAATAPTSAATAGAATAPASAATASAATKAKIVDAERHSAPPRRSSPPRISETPAAARPGLIPSVPPLLTPVPKGEASEPNPATEREPTPSSRAKPADLLWLVAINDNDQRDMSTRDVVAAFKNGLIDEYTFLWRDGMADWLTPFEVDVIASALARAGVYRARAGTGPGPGASTEYGESLTNDASTVVWQEPGLANGPSTGPLAVAGTQNYDDVTVAMTRDEIDAMQTSESPKTGFKPQAEAATPARAQVVERRADDGDLFSAFKDETLAAEEPESPSQVARLAQENLTGARGENSVLFSLNALVQHPAQTPERVTEDSLLSAPSASAAPGPRTALATPLTPFNPPDLDAAAPASIPPPRVVPMDADALSRPPPKGGRTGLWLGVLVVILLLAAIGGYVAYRQGLMPETWQRALGLQTSAPVSPAEPITPASEPKVAETVDQPVNELPEEVAGASGQLLAPVAEAGGAASQLQGAASQLQGAASQLQGAPGGAGTTPTLAANPVARASDATRAAATSESPQAAPTPSAAIPNNEESAEAAAAGSAAESVGAAGGPGFDTTAARDALASAAASAALSCKQPDGPTGTGKVSVTFAPSGNATQALVSGDFAGSAVGGCIARIFRNISVPPFVGSNQTVSKSVEIQ